MSREFKPGDVVRHFKRETVANLNSLQYLYIIVGTSKHSETGEKMMNYKPLYGSPPCIEGVDMASRPYDMFISEVDHERYPDIKQKYRFEKVENQGGS